MFLTPLGPLNRSWVTLIDQASKAEILEHAEEYFPCWRLGYKEMYGNRALRAILWQVVQWRSPKNESEHRQLEMIDEIVRRIEAGGDVLEADLKDALDELENAIQNDRPANGEGIGYKKRAVAYNPFSGWWMKVPGYFHVVAHEDGTVVQFLSPEVSVVVFAKTAAGPKNPYTKIRWDVDDPFEDEGSFLQSAVASVSDGDTLQRLHITVGADEKERLGFLRPVMDSVGFRKQ